MNKKSLWFVSIFLIISMTSLVFAACAQGNFVKYGELDDSWALVTSATPVNNAKMRGYVCSNSGCSSVSGSLFGLRNTNEAPAPNSYLDIAYPSFLLSPSGYGVFVYKNGYIPFEYRSYFADAACSAPDTTHYLTRKQNCEPELDSFVVTPGAGTINVNFDVAAPLGHGGSIDYVPPVIADQYTVDVSANLEVTKSGVPGIFYSETITKNAEFSGSRNFDFDFSVTPGTYHIYAYSSSTDAKCLDYTPDEENTDLCIPGTEICSDGIDNDCDGDIDCLDSDCTLDPSCFSGCLSDSECDDGLYCNGAEICDSGTCIGSTSPCTYFVDYCTDVSCNEATDSCESTLISCDDGLYCNGQETCNPSYGCWAGAPVDCSTNDIFEINTCDNNPDNNIFTLDYRSPFISTCEESSDSCTFGITDISHSCDVSACGAECELDADCSATNCSSNNGCYGGTYRDYDEIANTCLSGCQCTQNSCTFTTYTEIITDNDGDGFDLECEGDCDDSNPLINVAATEICDDGLDNDCDGLIDCADLADCSTHPSCITPCTSDSDCPIDVTTLSCVGKDLHTDTVDWYCDIPTGVCENNLDNKIDICEYGCANDKCARRNDDTDHDRNDDEDTCEDLCSGPWCTPCDGDYFNDGDAYLDSKEESGSQQELGTLPTIQDLTSGKIKTKNDSGTLSWITYLIVFLLIILLILIIIISIFRR
jgi:hypothetical protein